ncbi:MAG: hypothetical protein AAF539_07355 [Planctomycetota bacterium]
MTPVIKCSFLNRLTWDLLVILLPMSIANAHHPGEHDPVRVWPQVDVIGPLGNKLPASHRRQFNRPSYFAGKIAHAIVPSSQEAMAWHRAEHMGLYRNTGLRGHLKGTYCPPQRIEQHFFYPKPWEVLTTGPRRPSNVSKSNPEAINIDRQSEPEEDLRAPITIELIDAGELTETDR